MAVVAFLAAGVGVGNAISLSRRTTWLYGGIYYKRMLTSLDNFYDTLAEKLQALECELRSPTQLLQLQIEPLELEISGLDKRWTLCTKIMDDISRLQDRRMY